MRQRSAAVGAWLQGPASSAPFTRRVPIRMITLGDDDGKVSIENTKLEGMRDFIAVPVSHPLLMKDEEVIRQTLQFLSDGYWAQNPNSALEVSWIVKTHCAWPTSSRISSRSSAPKITARLAAQGGAEAGTSLLLWTETATVSARLRSA